MTRKIKSFPPVVGPKASLLILGTMPGKRSLEAQQYYAHPQNRFWTILGVKELPYLERCQSLIDRRIALWDVLAFCERKGSLDSNIKQPVPNDFATFFRKNPNIKTILCNGQKARQLLERFVDVPEDIERITMPGTSPANTRPGIIETWHQILGNTAYE